MPSNDVLVVIAVVSAVLALAKSGWDLYAGKKRDTQALAIAKKQAPEIQKQLELGNFKAAMEGVNIAQSIMGSELTRLQAREDELEAECLQWRQRAEAAESRATAAEVRAAAAESRAHRVEVELGKLERKCSALEAEIRGLREELL